MGANMQFILVGFTQELGFRVFAFQGIGADRSRTDFTVRTDLALSRQYGIQLQELPLLCKELLTRCDEGEERRTFTYAEEDMQIFVNDRAAVKDAAAKRRKPPRRPTPEQTADSWQSSPEYLPGR